MNIPNYLCFYRVLAVFSCPGDLWTPHPARCFLPPTPDPAACLGCSWLILYQGRGTQMTTPKLHPKRRAEALEQTWRENPPKTSFQLPRTHLKLHLSCQNHAGAALLPPCLRHKPSRQWLLISVPFLAAKNGEISQGEGADSCFCSCRWETSSLTAGAGRCHCFIPGGAAGTVGSADCKAEPSRGAAVP